MYLHIFSCETLAHEYILVLVAMYLSFGRLSLHTCMYAEKCEEVATSNIYSLDLLSLLLHVFMLVD